MFREFADGRSQMVIAQGLNKEGIPGPGGQLWRSRRSAVFASAVRGLLNNELCIDRLV